MLLNRINKVSGKEAVMLVSIAFAFQDKEKFFLHHASIDIIGLKPLLYCQAIDRLLA